LIDDLIVLGAAVFSGKYQTIRIHTIACVTYSPFLALWIQKNIMVDYRMKKQDNYLVPQRKPSLLPSLVLTKNPDFHSGTK